MPNIALLIFMYFTEWIIVYTYAKSIYEKRNRYSTIVSIFLFAILMLVYKFITDFDAVNVILTVICDVLCVFVCFKSTFRSALLHGMSLGISWFVSEVVSVYIISQILNITPIVYKDDVIINSINVIVSKLFYLFICQLLLKLSNKRNTSSSWGRWFSLSALPISSIFIILVVCNLIRDLFFSDEQKTAFVLALAMLLIANIIIYLVYEKAEKNNQKLIKLELADQKNEINMQYLQLLEAKIEEMNIMAHDYKNHLVAINDMCDAPDVKDYINRMFDDIYKYGRINKTKNKWLDVILSKYTDMCDAREITFETNVSTDNLDFINNYDISSLFNNILDNAYEAALDSTEKYIYLEIAKVLGSYHKVIVKNSSDIQPKAQDDKLLSTKKNKESHGFGTKSIQKVVNKYNGELQWNYDSDMKEFKLIILFPDNDIIKTKQSK